MYKRTSQLMVVGAAFAGLTLFGAATAAAAPAPAGAMVSAPAPAGAMAGLSTEADNRFQLPSQPRSSQQATPNPNRSVYGPYISSDQVRLVAD